MITKGIIEEIVDKYSARVRMPYFNKANNSTASTSFNNLCIATFCVPPHCTPHYKVGDVVFIAFEDHQVSEPIILGQLCRKEIPESSLSITAETVKATVDAYLPSGTYIGDVSPDEIKQLKGIKANLNLQLDVLSQRIAKLEERLNTHTYGILLDEGSKAVPTNDDADYALKIGAGSVKAKEWQKIAADVNGDGVIDSEDSLLIKQYISDPVVGQHGKVGQTFVYKED